MSSDCNKNGCHFFNIGCTELGMNLCNEITSKIIYLADDKEMKMTFTPPEKDFDFSTLPNLGKQHWKIDESLLI